MSTSMVEVQPGFRGCDPRHYTVYTRPRRHAPYALHPRGTHVHRIRSLRVMWVQRFPDTVWDHSAKPRLTVQATCGTQIIRARLVGLGTPWDGLIGCPKCFSPTAPPAGLCVCQGQQGEGHVCQEATP